MFAKVISRRLLLEKIKVPSKVPSTAAVVDKFYIFIEFRDFLVGWFDALILNIPVNSFSVMLGSQGLPGLNQC